MKSDRILIVDDEAAIREMISIALDLAGFDTIEAEDALQAHHKIVDEDTKTKTSSKIIPKLRDVEWIVFYGWLIANGFSGFKDDDEYTSSNIIKKLESGTTLTPKEEIELNNIKHNLLKKDGTYKKYVDPKEYLYTTHEKPLGAPLYDNHAKDFMWLASRSLGKSFLTAGILTQCFILYGKKYYDDSYLINPAPIDIAVGSAQTTKSTELLKKVTSIFDHLKTGPGSEPSPLWEHSL